MELHTIRKSPAIPANKKFRWSWQRKEISFLSDLNQVKNYNLICLNMSSNHQDSLIKVWFSVKVES